MNRQQFLQFTVAAFTSLSTGQLQSSTAIASSSNSQVARNRPNILWLSTEDLSPRLGCYGDSVADTPNLDRLAMEGVRFDNVFTTSPVCAPVRSGIITGMYPTSIGTHNMRTSHKGRTQELPTPYQSCPPPYVKSFTEFLRSSGYYCTNNSKTDYQFQVPISAWDESSPNAHWRNRPREHQPFFAVFNDTQTHESKTWQIPSQTDPDLVTIPPYYPDTPIVRQAIARLYDQIHLMDVRLGQRLQELEEASLTDNTVIFFWSDHGDGLPRGKRWPYDSGTRIPMIIKWPNHIQAGSVDNSLISSIDFAPTVLSIAGLDIPVWMQGNAFLGSRAGSQRKFVFSHRDRFDESYDMVRSIRDHHFRYVRNYYTNQPYVQWIPYRNNSPIMQELLRLQAEDQLSPNQKLWLSAIRPAEELYDCRVDPHHLNNLAQDENYQDKLGQLRNELDNWQSETKDLGGTPESELKRRFWPNNEQPQTSMVWLVPNSPNNRGQKRITTETANLQSPTMINFYCATEGASMVYTIDEKATEHNPHWMLGAGPIRLNKGVHSVRTKAIRYGYKESQETKCLITVN